ncbi:MAG: hypothetical protein LUQ38_11720 [Methanotrichaceae archaeon]|nr:hypothetical protein [Methanotrichaceae archaeon]
MKAGPDKRMVMNQVKEKDRDIDILGCLRGSPISNDICHGAQKITDEENGMQTIACNSISTS